jgi:hypothetical protein
MPTWRRTPMEPGLRRSRNAKHPLGAYDCGWGSVTPGEAGEDLSRQQRIDEHRCKSNRTQTAQYKLNFTFHDLSP